MPRDKNKQNAWQNAKRKRLREAGLTYRGSWVPKQTIKYSSTIRRIQVRKTANEMKKPVWRKR